ncbi:hypothetical protein EDB19DRAFT_1661821 [Suillus lakei]|nr:hypothetical protein EDB19DRAFT_1661821 [Suillus lakei]
MIWGGWYAPESCSWMHTKGRPFIYDETSDRPPTPGTLSTSLPDSLRRIYSMGALDNTFGALLIGVVVSAILYGVTCVQTWYYFTRYTSDSWRIKLLVGAVLVSDSTHQALITHAVYVYFVTDFDITSDLEQVVWSVIVEVLFNGFTALMVQSFLTMHIYILSNKSITATLSVLSLVVAEFVLVVIYFAKAIKFTTFIEITELKSLSMSVNAVAAAGDVLIAAYLCTLFQNHRTGFRSSDIVLNKLILYTISTGLLTSVCAVMSFISITVWHDTFIYIAFYFCLGRLYCNSLLATLNARKGLRSHFYDNNIVLSLHGINFAAGTPQRRMSNTIKVEAMQFARNKVGFSRAGAVV